MSVVCATSRVCVDIYGPCSQWEAMLMYVVCVTAKGHVDVQAMMRSIGMLLPETICKSIIWAATDFFGSGLQDDCRVTVEI